MRPIDEDGECGDRDDRSWSVMRHLFAAHEVALLANRVTSAPAFGALVRRTGPPNGLASCHDGTPLGAVALAAITRRANDDRTVTARAGVEPMRGGNRRPPARQGWTQRHPSATLAEGSRSLLAANPTKARVVRPGPSLLPEKGEIARRRCGGVRSGKHAATRGLGSYPRHPNDALHRYPALLGHHQQRIVPRASEPAGDCVRPGPLRLLVARDPRPVPAAPDAPSAACASHARPPHTRTETRTR